MPAPIAPFLPYIAAALRAGTLAVRAGTAAASRIPKKPAARAFGAWLGGKPFNSQLNQDEIYIEKMARDFQNRMPNGPNNSYHDAAEMYFQDPEFWENYYDKPMTSGFHPSLNHLDQKFPYSPQLRGAVNKRRREEAERDKWWTIQKPDFRSPQVRRLRMMDGGERHGIEAETRQKPQFNQVPRPRPRPRPVTATQPRWRVLESNSRPIPGPRPPTVTPPRWRVLETNNRPLHQPERQAPQFDLRTEFGIVGPH